MAGVSVPNSGGARGKRSLDLEIPLVPFIDLLCSLIVFLLMTAVWSQIARLELKQGNAAPPDPTQTATPEPDKEKDLRVELHEKGFTIVEDNKIEVFGDGQVQPVGATRRDVYRERVLRKPFSQKRCRLRLVFNDQYSHSLQYL